MVTFPLNANDFVSQLKRIATEHKTVYAWGMFGSKITKSSVTSKAKQYPEWYKSRDYSSLYGKNYYGFDCIGLIKAVLWGWSAEFGARYDSNEVPDVSANNMILRCLDVSSNFSDIAVGEFVWMQGHCGIYIGNGNVVESTPKWKNGVQITALSARRWLKHGKLPYLHYEEVKDTVVIEMSILKKGADGPQVKTLQRLLLSLGYDLGRYGADGDFGNKTDAAVRAYQKANKLTVDGEVGKNTWSKLLGVK